MMSGEAGRQCHETTSSSSGLGDGLALDLVERAPAERHARAGTAAEQSSPPAALTVDTAHSFRFAAAERYRSRG